MATPTSANTAAHIPAIPNAPSKRIAPLTPRANTIFCTTMVRVCLAKRMASANFVGSSVISTTSDASIAASVPRPPMAMPTSARARQGASLIPSPINTSLPAICSSCSSFSWGKSWAWYSSRFNSFATDAATASLSPVSITVFCTPSAFSSRRAAAASAFTLSAIRIEPAKTPSTATYTAVPGSSQGV